MERIGMENMVLVVPFEVLFAALRRGCCRLVPRLGCCAELEHKFKRYNILRTDTGEDTSRCAEDLWFIQGRRHDALVNLFGA